MSASEFAFLALGLLLGAASGVALGVVFRSRPPRREIRLTVTHAAVPRRASTLSDDAVGTNHAEPAPGGPADRRQVDRQDDDDHGDRRDRAPDGPGFSPARAVRETDGSRTIVRSGSAVAVAIHPETDHGLEFLRSGGPRRPLVERILHGDHRAMLVALDAIAGADGALRRDWEVLLSGLAEALTERSIDLGILDFPIGTAFWDTFTIEQCRQIAGSLASLGYRFDGDSGWADFRVPSYRDLNRALGDIGMEPRRVRAWPNAVEIAELYLGARAAPADAVAHWAPTLDASDLQELLGPRADDVGDLWLTWDSIRPILLDPEAT
ncbi:MAG TPA: hypothetical protein VGQ85_08450 [Candidatus Limnocylindrales bacterium]|nr:hypothetical protein [Candidatus Limnocylindrales bacterium]